VADEISGLKPPPAALYFTLKERIRRCAACLPSAHRFWKFKPADGLAVLRRRASSLRARGEYSCRWKAERGLGALQLAFEN